jgi:transcriptional regulator with XRE-family HTH domain
LITWPDIRAHYERQFRAEKVARNRTQQEVAENGGLSRNNAISKLLSNHRRGPSVDTFVRAVQGLGISLSEFFASLERGEDSARRARSEPQQSADVKHALEIVRAILDALESQARPRRK